MKITAPREIFRFLDRVQSKRDGDSSQGNPNHSGQDPKQNREKQEATPEKIDAAIAEFGNEDIAKANGLKASREGQGPGLKVVLRDSSGSILQHYTGEEFLELRKATSLEGKTRGKLLDRKL